MQVRKLHEQQGIKQTSTDAKIAAFKAKLRISSQPKEGDVKKTKWVTPEESAWRRNRGISVVMCQALGSKCREPGWLLGSSKEETNMSCVDDESAICASVWSVHLSAHNNLAGVKTKIDFDSHADICVIGGHCLVVHDNNRPVNVFGSDHKAGSKHTCIVNATVAYTKPETGHMVILLINQVIDMKGLDQHLLCSMQCHMNGVQIDEVPSSSHPFPVRPHMPNN